MTKEKDIGNVNQRKTAGGEKETKTSFQVQKQSEIEDCDRLFGPPKQNLKSKNTYQNRDSNVDNSLKKSQSFSSNRKSVKGGSLKGLKPSMSRGWLGVSGIWSVVGLAVLLVARVGGSEFPERECCDPVYPPNTATTAAAPVTQPVPKLAGKIIFLFIENIN